jgi:hypothetical protein
MLSVGVGMGLSLVDAKIWRKKGTGMRTYPFSGQRQLGTEHYEMAMEWQQHHAHHLPAASSQFS